jgi:hypothetical protein
MVIQYAVAAVKGSDPEAFMIIGMDFDARNAKMGSLSKSFSEPELREHLALHGMTPEEITAAIDQARRDPK